MTTFVILLLALWLLLSALTQLKLRVFQRLKARDIFSLLPNWSFFAPRPGTFDYHILFRDSDSSGEFGKWEEVPLADQRTLWGAVWNPQKRNKKALSDAVHAITLRSKDGPGTRIQLSIPYLAALNYISSIPRSNGSTHTQFMILRSEGFLWNRDPELVFLSYVHRL